MISTRNRNLAGFGNNIDSNGHVTITSLTLDSAHLGDNAAIFFGDSNDLQIVSLTLSNIIAAYNKPTLFQNQYDLTIQNDSGGAIASFIAGSRTVSVTNLSLNGEAVDSAWVAARSTGGGGGSSVTVDSTAPVGPSAGDLWFDAANGYLFVYYEDVDTQQWVQTTTAGDNPLAYDSDTSTYLLVGNLTTTGDVNSQSDARLKTEIEQINNALDKVSRLRGVEYNKDGKRHIGLIAQEVEQVIPEVVSTANDPMETKSVAYGNIVGLLIEAINELRAEVESLKENR